MAAIARVESASRLKDDQTVDADAVKAWVQRARELAGEAKRIEITDVNIGEILSELPEGSDGLWPHESVREMLEELDNSRIENGLYVGRLNSRGITSRSIVWVAFKKEIS
jgi:hypothetical protein